FQIFDPATVAPPGTDLRRLDRLDARGILPSGFIEHDGRVVLNGLTGERGSRGGAWPGGVGTPEPSRVPARGPRQPRARGPGADGGGMCQVETGRRGALREADWCGSLTGAALRPCCSR